MVFFNKERIEKIKKGIQDLKKGFQQMRIEIWALQDMLQEFGKELSSGMDIFEEKTKKKKKS